MEHTLFNTSVHIVEMDVLKKTTKKKETKEKDKEKMHK
jgi:hypothetical protein